MPSNLILFVFLNLQILFDFIWSVFIQFFCRFLVGLIKIKDERADPLLIWNQNQNLFSLDTSFSYLGLINFVKEWELR